MACSLLFPVICQVLSLVATPANALDAGLLSRIVFINAFRYMFISRYVTSDGAPHHGVLAATPATSGSMCANATRFIHIWMASVQVGLRVQWTSVFMKLSLLLHALYHLPALSAISVYCGLRIPVTASPISRNRQCTPLRRAASSRSPAYMRPVITSNCRVYRQDGLTWARSLLDHAASYLYAWMPRHGASSGTLHTLRNFRELLQKKESKKPSASRSNNVLQKPERPVGSQSVRHSSETFVASPEVYALLSTWISTPIRMCRNGYSTGLLFMGDDNDSTPHKQARVESSSSMEFNLNASPATPASLFSPPSPGPRVVTQPHVWGSLMALPEDIDGDVFAARIKQLITAITFTAFVQVTPTDDKVCPMDRGFERFAVVSAIQENLVDDEGKSVVRGAIRGGGVRSITLADFPLGDGTMYALDFNLDIGRAANSAFMKRRLAGLDAAVKSPLSPDEMDTWLHFNPEGATHTFSLLLLPSIRADQTGLIASSAQPPAQVRRDICEFLHVQNLKELPMAVYARGEGSEIVSLEPGLLARVIQGVQHLGTPANSGTNCTLCRPIRILPAISTTRTRTSQNAGHRAIGNLSANQAGYDPNPPFSPEAQYNPLPRAVLRLPWDSSAAGPANSLTFRFGRGSPGDIVTTVALHLANFFRQWLKSNAETAEFEYWMSRVLVKVRLNKPVRVVVAATHGALFAGVYEALQHTVFERLDRLTRIALSTGLCLSTVCLGGSFCHKCGKPGHVGRECPQSTSTPRLELTYRCPLCGDLAGPGKGHEWDTCNRARLIQMGSPSATTCGICGHPEHSTPQCPCLYDEQRQDVVLLPKMRAELVAAGWELGTDSQLPKAAGTLLPGIDTPTRSLTKAVADASPESSSSSALSQIDTTSALSASASITATNAAVMTDLQHRISQTLQLQFTTTLQRELQPLKNEMTEVKQAMADQSKHVGELTDLVSTSTAFMARVSAANKRNSQQLLALRDQLNRMARPADQMTVASQEDPFVDAEDYDPAFPTDTLVGEPTPPGLKSPDSEMQI